MAFRRRGDGPFAWEIVVLLPLGSAAHAGCFPLRLRRAERSERARGATKGGGFLRTRALTLRGAASPRCSAATPFLRKGVNAHARLFPRRQTRAAADRRLRGRRRIGGGADRMGAQRVAGWGDRDRRVHG